MDVIEINHYYNEEGRLIYDQVIYYDWNPVESRYDIIDWRLLKTEGQIPLRDRRSGGFVSVWHDAKEYDVLRTVRSQTIRETWTNHDPEQRGCELRPAERQRGLRERCAWGRGGESAGQAEHSLQQNLHP